MEIFNVENILSIKIKADYIIIISYYNNSFASLYALLGGKVFNLVLQMSPKNVNKQIARLFTYVSRLHFRPRLSSLKMNLFLFHFHSYLLIINIRSALLVSFCKEI